MTRWQARSLLIPSVMASALLGAPSESKAAIFDWLFPCCNRRATATTTYVPPTMSPVALAPRYTVAPAMAAAPAVMPTTCCYVPQTSYRAVLRPVTTTVLSPVRSYDPCTGCPVTSYRPITAIAQQTMMVPYTTYRVVCSAPAPVCAPVGCAPCGAAAPSTFAPSGCSSCAPSLSSPGVLSPTPAPSLPSSLSPTVPGLSPSTAPGPISSTLPNAVAPPISAPAPVTPPGGYGFPGSSQSGPQSTFKGTGSSGGSDTTNPRPEPDARSNPAGRGLPKYLIPDGRTASVPVRQASYYEEASSDAAVRSNASYRAGIDDWESDGGAAR